MKDGPRWLVIRFRAIGDCVMVTWPVTAIRQAQPDANISWAVETRCSEVIDRAELVQRVHKFPRDQWKKRRWSARTWREQLACYGRLRNRHFDFGIDFQGHSKTAIALRIAKPKQRLSVAATDFFAQRMNPVAAIPDSIQHTVERHMFALRQLIDAPDVSLPIMPKLPQHAEHLELPNQFVSLMTGASSRNKSVPIDTWRAVAKELMDLGLPVVAVGGPSDPTLDLAGAIDLVGKTSLRTTLEIVRRSACHIAADTGTGHMAAAYGVPVLSVFGSEGHSPEKFRPYSEQAKVLTAQGSASNASSAEILAAFQQISPIQSIN